MNLRYVTSLMMAAALSAVGEVIPFNLQQGSQAGLAAPEGVTSPGTGGEIESGIWYDTETRVLTFVVGYGTAAGFADLTAPVVAARIQGPKSDGATPPVIDPKALLYALDAVHFPNSDPLKGGILRGEVTFSESETNDLLAGLDFINLTTTNFVDGEILGYLKPVWNQAPVLSCPDDVTQECRGREGNLLKLTVDVADPEGDAMGVVWTVNGVPALTKRVPAGDPGTVVELTLEKRFQLGEHVVKVVATDAKTNRSECTWKVIIEDTTPPVFRRITTDPRYLWPPNHKLVRVKVKPEILDCSPVTWKIVSVSSNEPVDDKGDGKTAPDWTITGDQGLWLRAERMGNGTGRIYTVELEATDAGGLKTTGTVEVKVPHSMGKR